MHFNGKFVSHIFPCAFHSCQNPCRLTGIPFSLDCNGLSTEAASWSQSNVCHVWCLCQLWKCIGIHLRFLSSKWINVVAGILKLCVMMQFYDPIRAVIEIVSCNSFMIALLFILIDNNNKNSLGENKSWRMRSKTANDCECFRMSHWKIHSSMRMFKRMTVQFKNHLLKSCSWCCCHCYQRNCQMCCECLKTMCEYGAFTANHCFFFCCPEYCVVVLRINWHSPRALVSQQKPILKGPSYLSNFYYNGVGVGINALKSFAHFLYVIFSIKSNRHFPFFLSLTLSFVFSFSQLKNYCRCELAFVSSNSRN